MITPGVLDFSVHDTNLSWDHGQVSSNSHGESVTSPEPEDWPQVSINVKHDAPDFPEVNT